MSEMNVPRKVRVWAERVTAEPPFVELGIPEATDFYVVLEERLQTLPPRYRAILARARHAAIEHLDTAREALERMREIEQQRPTVSAEFFPAIVRDDAPVVDEGGVPSVWVRRSEGVIDTGYLEGQFARALRVFAHESRAAIESLVYELSFAIEAVPKNKAGDDDEGKIGIANQQTKDAFAKKATTTHSKSLKALCDHFVELQAEPFYKEIESLRRMAYHRTVPYVLIKFVLDGISATEIPEVTALAFHRPLDFEDPTPDPAPGERYTTFCALTLAALAGSLNRAYVHARKVMLEIDAAQ